MVIALLVVAFFLALLSAAMASNIGGISSMGYVWLLWPLLAVAMLLIVWAARGTERLSRRALPGLRIGLTLAVLAFVTFAVVKLHNSEQRCVDKHTMTVVAATNCQHQASPGTTGNQDSYVWYYGGRGTQVGDPVEDGSVTPPEEESGGSGGGGTGGSNSGDTGDDGGDDGGDSGGGDSGGGDGGD